MIAAFLTKFSSLLTDHCNISYLDGQFITSTTSLSKSINHAHRRLISLISNLSIHKMRLWLFLTLCSPIWANVIHDPVKSYENYKVFRVEIPTAESFDTLSSFSNLHFWNEGRIGGHVDVMVAPEHISKLEQDLSEFKYSTMVENVGDLIKLAEVSIHSKLLKVSIPKFSFTTGSLRQI